MALHKVCAVFDSAIQSFGTPVFVVHTGAAIRSFQDEVNREGSPFHAHPGDFELYFLGVYDDQSGRLDSSQAIECLIRGKDVERRHVQE